MGNRARITHSKARPLLGPNERAKRTSPTQSNRPDAPECYQHSARHLRGIYQDRPPPKYSSKTPILSLTGTSINSDRGPGPGRKPTRSTGSDTGAGDRRAGSCSTSRTSTTAASVTACRSVGSFITSAYRAKPAAISIEPTADSGTPSRLASASTCEPNSSLRRTCTRFAPTLDIQHPITQTYTKRGYNKSAPRASTKPARRRSHTINYKSAHQRQPGKATQTHTINNQQHKAG
jgi:hypothetical protein